MRGHRQIISENIYFASFRHLGAEGRKLEAPNVSTTPPKIRRVMYGKGARETFKSGRMTNIKTRLSNSIPSDEYS